MKIFVKLDLFVNDNNQNTIQDFFFGGGSDFPSYYRKFGGCVIGSTINKFCYLSLRELPPFLKINTGLFGQKYNFQILFLRLTPVYKGVLNYFKIKHGIEIHHQGDLPAFSGIGSSSSFSVGLINALMTLKDRKMNKNDLENYHYILNNQF